ncbi:bifunctional 4-hydroxy-2-oxoglutarate aldolase/2-dehydro-3-deoxy-phosphogluconate aldolase [Streptomyces sp. NPDC058741]|uniref:bifunctional 4-hydroxy-2-oxoglutarate aldolase/2-dehydro-3-deoxy-phosphogluconate aldolase n=1 Tax=Streptomyces sp. NPDC058741 TaxID=3346620 RepID=UPI0036BE0E8C
MTSPSPLPASVLDLAPVVPVVVEDAGDAVPPARALVAGGLSAIEVTVRTPAAVEAIRRIVREVPGAVVGPGGWSPPGGQVAEVVEAGARFLVSPGWTDRLLEAMRASGLPFLPEVSTTSEVVAPLERGVRETKFFPAQAGGGAAYLRSLARPLPQARFCPTGGIGPDCAPDFLALPNVGCAGGSWVLPPDAVAGHDWGRVEALARAAAALSAGGTCR